MSSPQSLVVTHGTELATMHEQSFSAAQIVARVKLIQEVKESVMKIGVHYGVIPGMPKDSKPALFKPGAEILLMTFRIAPELEIIDLQDPSFARIRVKVHGYTIEGRKFVGTGIGEVSSGEERYMWRKAIVVDEFEATPEDKRRIKFKKYKKDGQFKVYTEHQIRTNLEDLRNTLVKMAKKRALVDLALTATAASDMFEQDIDDLPEELRQREEDGGEREITNPQRVNGAKPEQQQASTKAECPQCLARVHAVNPKCETCKGTGYILKKDEPNKEETKEPEKQAEVKTETGSAQAATTQTAEKSTNELFPEERTQQPTSTGATGKVIGKSKAKRLYAILNTAKLHTEAELKEEICKRFKDAVIEEGEPHVHLVPESGYDDLCKWAGADKIKLA